MIEESHVSESASPPPYDGTTLEQLEQILEAPVWDGNLISKTSRDRLREDACIVKDEDARDPKGPTDVGAWVSTKKGRLIAFMYVEDEGLGVAN